MIRVVLVEPKFPVNLGSVCRVMRNFGARELFLVKPVTPISQEAIKYAKHARDLLEGARIVDDFEHAIIGCNYVVGTTGVVPRFKYALKNCIAPRDVTSKVTRRDRLAVVFGNEGSGLDLATLKKCDAIVSIPAARKFGVLNLSHAVAVLLYELYVSRKVTLHYRPARRTQVKYLQRMFGEIVDSIGEIRDKGKVMAAFDNVLSRSRVSDEELQALFVAFGGVRKRLRNGQ